MTIYQATNLGENLSQFAVGDDAQDQAIIAHQAGSVEPTIKPHGTLWLRTDYPTYGEALLYRTVGGAWSMLADPDYAALNAGGTVPLAADLPCGGQKLTGLAAGSAAGHSVRYEQAVLVSGANPLAANLNMGGFRLTGVGIPTAATDAARRGDFATGRASLSGSARATTGDIDLGFVPRMVIFRALGWRPGGAGTQFYSSEDYLYSNASAVASSDSFGIWLYDEDRAVSAPSVSFVNPDNIFRFLSIANADAVDGFRVEVQDTRAEGPPGNLGGDAWDGYVEWAAWR